MFPFFKAAVFLIYICVNFSSFQTPSYNLAICLVEVLGGNTP